MPRRRFLFDAMLTFQLFTPARAAARILTLILHFIGFHVVACYRHELFTRPSHFSMATAYTRLLATTD